MAPWAAPAEEAATAISTPVPEWAPVCWTLEVRLAEVDCRKPMAARLALVDAAAERLRRLGRSDIQIGLALEGAILATVESELTGEVAEMVRLPLLVCNGLDASVVVKDDEAIVRPLANRNQGRLRQEAILHRSLSADTRDMWILLTEVAC